MAIPGWLERRLPKGHCNDELPLDWKSVFTRVLMACQRRLYGGYGGSGACSRAAGRLSMDESIGLIERRIREGRPFMAGKIGTGDMETIQRYVDIHDGASMPVKWLKLLAGRCGPFWWDNWIRAGICVCAGVFPADDDAIEEFCGIFMDYCRDIDAVPGWLPGESRIYGMLCPEAAIIELESLVPEGSRTWYGALAGKKVLVVHPYVDTIRSQYAKRVEFHRGQGPLPEFELLQYRPVNSIGGKCASFPRWKDALGHMIEDVSKMDFDVALLGCGVYGVPLSVHIKRMGRMAIYTGGATQTIFGIMGRRWDRTGLYNEHWVRPMPQDIPENMSLIEGGTFL